MIRNVLVFVLFATSSCVVLYGQTPEAKKEKEKVVKNFAWSFDAEGGYLGVQTQEVNKDNFGKFGLREVRGVAVEKVMENSPAAAAGIQNGDVIVRFNGEEVTSVRKLTRLIGEVDPDHQARISVFRNGAERDIAVTVGKRPMPKFADGNFEFQVPQTGRVEIPQTGEMPELPKGEMPRVFTFPDGEGRGFAWRAGAGRQIGIGVTSLTKQLATHFGVDAGVMINNVRENSPAAKAGLKAGDIIVEAEGKAVKGDFDLIRAINEKKEGDVQITFVRDGSRQTISVTPEAAKDNGFVFQTDDENGLATPAVPALPNELRITRPAMQPMPMAAPAPMTLAHPGRIL